MQTSQIPLRKTFNAEGLPVIIADKVSKLIDQLNSPMINTNRIRAFLADGIPDQAKILREYCWRVILGNLPENKNHWESKVKTQNQNYRILVEEFLPAEKFPDYPILMNKKHPKWKQYEQDFCLWEQIEKDTSRTHAELTFFVTPAPEIIIPYLTHPRKQKFKIIYGDEGQIYKEFLNNKEQQRKTYRYDYMSRILYIYAKLNPKVLYVQGMNQILAPIFYIVNAGRPPGSVIDEASCFYMFNNAITDIIELHIKDLDKSQNGIYGKINKVNQMLVVIQPQIWSRLESLKIDPFFYCFRWMTLLFAQEFPLFDTLRIWESIFSCQNRIQFMNFFAIAIISTSKDFIMKNEFVEVLSYLQNIGQFTNVNKVINTANILMKQYQNSDFKEEAVMQKQGIKRDEEKKKAKSQSSKVLDKVSEFMKKIF